MLHDVVKFSRHDTAQQIVIRKPLVHALGWEPRQRLMGLVDREHRIYRLMSTDAWCRFCARRPLRSTEVFDAVQVTRYGNSLVSTVPKELIDALNWAPGVRLFCGVNPAAQLMLVCEVSDWARATRAGVFDERLLEPEAVVV